METKKLTNTYKVYFQTTEGHGLIEEYTDINSDKTYYTNGRELSGATDLFKASARLAEELLHPPIQPFGAFGAGLTGIGGLRGCVGVPPIKLDVDILKEFEREDLPLLIGFFKDKQMEAALEKVLGGENE